MNHVACDFDFSKQQVESLEASLSPGRMQLYRKFASDDDKEALKLYCWNNSLSQSLFWPLHGLEISLRNAMADRLFNRYGADWYDQLEALKKGKPGRNDEADKVDKLKESLLKDGEVIGHDSIVAGISFGFWEGLLKVEYELLLWKEAEMFSELFPVNRNEAFRTINQIKRLRNNVAHHEPIFVHWPSKEFRELYRDFKKIIRVARWICPDTATWIEHHATQDFFYAWNSAPKWLAVRQDLRVKNMPTSGLEAESDNWCW